MKKAMFLLVFCLIALSLVAQSPEWLWAKQAGGASDDTGFGIATDSSGNSYITGEFDGTATFGLTTLISSSGSYDIFIAKLDTNGNYLWAKQAGGTSIDEGYDIATDSSGNSYITGYFQSTATFGNTTLISSGNDDIFIAKIDTNGNWLWVKQAGGTSGDCGLSIALDSSGNSYVTGWFYGTATFGSTTLTSSGYSDIFIAKLDTNGNWLWTKQAGGTIGGLGEHGSGIATDSSGNSYVTGQFYNTATFGSTLLTSSGSGDIFVAKLDTSGNFLWAKKAGGARTDHGTGIATDISGNGYVTGWFQSTVSFGTTTLTSSGLDDVFIAKLDTNGNWLWAKQAGGTYFDQGTSIANDSSGNSYVTGYFYVTATFGSTILTNSGCFNIFIAKLDTNGNWLWAIQAGGTSDIIGYGIATDSNGNGYVAGIFIDTAAFGDTILTTMGYNDIFIAKLSNSTLLSDEYGVPQARFSLGQNHPNPFTASTSFELEVSDAKSVYEVSVYDLRGRHICTLYRGVLPLGEQTFAWNGMDAANKELSSGVYFYRVTNGITSQVKKMIYVR